MTHPTTAARDLYEAILRELDDDAPRLMYADELDENGQDDADRVRAEFIRLQIAFSSDRSLDLSRRLSSLIDALQVPAKMLGIGPDWSWSGDCESAVVTPNDGKGIVYTFRRGFVDEVAMTMQQFMGGECRHRPQSLPRHLRCQDCNGTGRVPGLASVICAKWPVTEIRLVGREPWYERGVGGEHCWWRESVWSNRGGHSRNEVGNLPDVLFEKIAELYPDNRFSWSGPPHNQHIGFDSREAAIDALSRAAVAYARGLAGLPVHNTHAA